MDRLIKIERVRLYDKQAEMLRKLSRFGIKKSKFIREAIQEKIERDIPKLVVKSRSRLPF